MFIGKSIASSCDTRSSRSSRSRCNGHIPIIIDVVSSSNVDLHLYVIGSGNQNPLFFSATLNCFYDALSLLFRKSVEKRALIDQLDTVFLILDEICDNGVCLVPVILLYFINLTTNVQSFELRQTFFR